MKRSAMPPRRTPLKRSPLAVVSRKPARKTELQADRSWSESVIARDRHCRWPGCDTPKFVLSAHHGIRRGNKQTRHALANGITLCLTHHQLAEANGAEWKMNPEHIEALRWLDAGGWWQNGQLVTPGEWLRRKEAETY